MLLSHLLPYPEAQGSFFILVRSTDADFLKRLCPTCHQQKLESQVSISNLYLLPSYPLFDRKPLKNKNQFTKLLNYSSSDSNFMHTPVIQMRSIQRKGKEELSKVESNTVPSFKKIFK